MELRAARASERDQVLDLLALWYGDRDFFSRYNRNDPGFRDELCLVACDGGRIVATAQIFERAINLRGEHVRLGGVGSVYTLAGYRSRGLGSALMRLAVTTMEREGFEVSLLFAERLDFYARFGWRPVTRQFSALADSASMRVSGQWRLTHFDPARDLEQIAALHRSYSGRFDGTAIRDGAAWRGNLAYAGNPGEYFVTCRAAAAADTIVAYARAILFHGFPMVMEYGYAPDAHPAMLALVRHLGEAASGVAFSNALAGGGGDPSLLQNPATAPSGLALLVTHTAHDPELERQLGEAGVFVMHHPDNFFMWRAIAARKLSRRLGVPAENAEAQLLSILQEPTALYWTADRF
ncbi:MAG TPA: GNAT family N-acetyltransferase [Candidatus Binataceae bacterium]|nr:GNAT family N-acetyltransferase [Candidatus Binataceae bacterium]